MAYEVITTTDKAKRDEMFQNLKRNGNHMERQVVKFSGSEPVLDGFGKQAVIIAGKLTERETIQLNDPAHPILTRAERTKLSKKIRPLHRSTWSVAYPVTPDVQS